MAIIVKEKGKKDVIIEPSKRDEKILQARLKYKHTIVQDKRKRKPKYKDNYNVED